MYVYNLNITDYWDGLVPLRKYIREELATPKDWVNNESHAERVEKLKKFVKRCFDAVYTSDNCWEGDVRGYEIYIGGLPYNVTEGMCNTELFLTWKQDNNGSCFLVSPFKLSYLGGECEPIEYISINTASFYVRMSEKIFLEIERLFKFDEEELVYKSFHQNNTCIPLPGPAENTNETEVK